ncbi:MAG: hypothetical protein OHK0039_03180 [Bacteroidia bacterium]
MKNPIILLLLLLCGSQPVWSQSFAARFQSFSRQAPSFVTLQAGETLAGHFKGGTFKKGLFKQIAFEDTVAGETRKIMATEIASMKLVPSTIGRIGATMEATQSITRIGNTDLNQLDADFVYFQQALLPDKKGTTVLLQKVNPGFDSKIQVYDDPWAQETAGLEVGGMAVSGGNVKSYYLIRDGRAVKVFKSTYKKEFANIYGDCPALMEAFDDIDWLDFAKHVAAHEQLCD